MSFFLRPLFQPGEAVHVLFSGETEPVSGIITYAPSNPMAEPYRIWPHGTPRDFFRSAYENAIRKL